MYRPERGQAVADATDHRASIPAVYERSRQRPISRLHYGRRLLAHSLFALGLLFVSLLAGMWGYHYLEGLGWMDAFLNAAMLLGGEGPIENPRTQGGKLFAGLYALYSGVLFVAVAALMLAPVAHRVLHKFHWEGKNED